MQDYPGAPGTARPGNAGTAVPAACGGAAVQPMPQAPDHNRSSAAPMPMPKAPDHNRSRAAPMPMPKAPGHQRSDAASMASPGHARCGPVTAGRSVPMATAPVPAQASRQLQEVLPRVPATPRTLTYPQSCPNTAKNQTAYSYTPTDHPSHSTTHQVRPAIQVPTRPPPATAGTGAPRQHPSRAPPPPFPFPYESCQLDKVVFWPPP